jgi:tetratricopeptide (TPR) repeat protein
VVEAQQAGMSSSDTSGSLPLKSEVAQTFLTHRMSHAAILAVRTGREREFAILRDALARSLDAAPGALQHVVIYGPRGFGKSFTARVAQIHAQDMASADVPIPFVLLPEEQINLTRNPHALPDYIAHRLKDLHTGEDRSWANAMFQWPDPQAHARLWTEACVRLETELDAALPAGKGLAVVVIENFDYLLATVFKDELDEQRLRAWLDRPSNRLMVIATATGSVDIDYERPLFQAFQSIPLEPWPPETAIEYFNRRRAAEGRPALDATQLPKARAVAEFIGGNPRLAQLLAEVLDTHDALSVTAVMDALADRLADYYRRRIDDLPPTGQGLLDALIRGGEPASQTELARRVGADSQATIARTMQDLQRADVVRGIPAPDGRDVMYRVTDRVFAHFYRVRQGQQAALRTPLATILEFLQAFYTAQEKRRQALLALDAGRAPDARLFASLAREGPPGYAGSNQYLRGFGLRWARALRHLSEPVPPGFGSIEAMLAIPEDVARDANGWQPATRLGLAARAIVVGQALVRMGLESEGLQRLADAGVAASDDLAATMMLGHELGWMKRSILNDRDGAVEAWEAVGRAASDAPTPELRSLALRSAAYVAWATDRAAESLEFARQAEAVSALAGLVGEQGYSLLLVSKLESHVGRHQESINAARHAADLAARDEDHELRAGCLKHVGWALSKLGRDEEAVLASLEAASVAARVEAFGEQASALRNAAWSLGRLDRHEEAIKHARDAAAIADRDNNLAEHAESLRHGAWSMNQLGRSDEAVDQLIKAATIAGRGGFLQEQANCLRLAGTLCSRSEHASLVLTLALENQRAALDTDDSEWIVAAAIACVSAAQWVPSADAVVAFGAALGCLADDPRDLRRNLSLFAAEWLAACVVADAWDELDAADTDRKKAFRDLRFASGQEAASAVGRVAAARGRAAAFSATRELLTRLRAWGTLDGSYPGLSIVINALATSIHDSGLLRDIAALLTNELAPDVPKQAALLLELATFDEAPDKAAKLVRADPDVATWLRRVRGLPDTDATLRPRRRGGLR